jgi:hypothetical protein
MKRAFRILLVASFGLSGCASPEASRTRGGGPGGDPGNRPATVKMHEGSQQYWKTPQVIPGEHPPLEPARQARDVSLR